MRANGLSAADKLAVTAACQQLIDDFLKPRFLPTIRPTQFNYPVDIRGKWHGTKYRFIQRYRSNRRHVHGLAAGGLRFLPVFVRSPAALPDRSL
jgi:hypothetical protein